MDSSQRKINPWMVSTLILLGIIVGFGVSQVPYFKGINTQANVVKENPKPTPEGNQKASLTQEQIAKLADDDPVQGEANAPVTVVEFSDFQCPYCSRFVKMIMPSIYENYVKTGKVKFVFRDFPLDGHPNALPAALATECANEQGKFWEMHDMIFNQQTEWSPSEKVADMFAKYAKELGLDTKQFGECYKSQKFASEIKKDLLDAVSVGVNGTPSFFINGKEISGAMPYETVFKPAFDAELAGKKWELQFDANGQPSVKVF